MNVISSFSGEHAFLSNFYFSPFTDTRGLRFDTVEHYFQAQKAVKFVDHEVIRTSGAPSEAKYLGRKIRLREDWEQIKDAVMMYALMMKFNSDPKLASCLVETGSALLLEGNGWHDNYWGDCWCEKCENNRGLNKLGEYLMFIRKDLQL